MPRLTIATLRDGALLIPAFLAALAGCAGPGSTAPASRATPNAYGISQTTLANGLDVIVVENHALPLVTVQVAVRTGAFAEPPEYDGLSHLFEHMILKGNAVYPDEESFYDRMKELGASSNATTSAELVNYFMSVHKKNLYAAAELLRDAITTPLFARDELLGEFPVVLAEFDRNEANPEFHFRREVGKRLWSEHYSRKNTLGDRDVIFNVTREQMKEIKGRYYVPNNSALIVGGDVRPDEIFDMAERLFGAWERKPDPHKKWPVPEHPPMTGNKRVVVVGPVRTAAIQIGWHGPSMGKQNDDTYAADVFSFILGQRDSSFHRALVDTGLVDGVSLSYYSLAHTGPISLGASTSPGRVDAAWEAINAEIAKFADPDYITDEQIESAKTMLEISGIYDREETNQFCRSLAFWWSTGGGLDYYLGYEANLRKVGRADLKRYVERYIIGKPRVEALLIGKDEASNTDFAATAEIVEPTFGSSAVALDEGPASTEVSTDEFDVDGLSVVLRRNPTSELVVASMLLRGGNAYFGADRAGQELLALQSLNKGSDSFSKEEVSRRLARTGASLSASARHDYSTFTLRTLRRDFEENFALFGDALAHPTFADQEIALARERRLNAISMAEENPDSFLSVLAGRNFFAGHPYEVPASGSKASIKAVTPEALRELYAENLHRTRMKLFIAGNITEDEISDLIRTHLKDIDRGEYEPATFGRDPGRAPNFLFEARDLPTNYIFGSFAAPNLAHEDMPATQVAVSILSDRLHREIRTKRNLTYAVMAMLSSRQDNYGILYVTTVKPNEVFDLMMAEVNKLAKEPVKAEVLENKIEQMITRDLLGNQTAASQVGRLVLYDVNGGGWARASGSLDRMRAVTPASIQEAAAKYLKNFSFSVIGSAKAFDRDRFSE